MQGVDQTLKSHKMSNHLEDPENSHNPQKPDDLPSFPNDVQILKTSEDDGEEVRNQCNQVHLGNKILFWAIEDWLIVPSSFRPW